MWSVEMHIDIPHDLNRRLEQLAKGTGQDVGALVCAHTGGIHAINE